MATLSGTEATVNLGSALVADMASWTLDRSRDALRAPVFGDVNSKIHGMGSKTWSGTIDGYLNIADSTGQDVLEAAYENGTKLTNFRLYIDGTNYYSPDVSGDADAGVYISNLAIGVAQDEIISVSFTFEGTGALSTA